MMLVDKTGDAQCVCFRTLDNTPPNHAHCDVGLSDLFEGRIKITVPSADLNAVPGSLVRAAVIDSNHIATLQVRRDFVDPADRCLVENRFIKGPFEEDKPVVIETYQSLPPVANQAHRHRIQQFVGKMDAHEWLKRIAPFNL